MKATRLVLVTFALLLPVGCRLLPGSGEAKREEAPNISVVDETNGFNPAEAVDDDDEAGQVIDPESERDSNVDRSDPDAPESKSPKKTTEPKPDGDSGADSDADSDGGSSAEADAEPEAGAEEETEAVVATAPDAEGGAKTDRAEVEAPETKESKGSIATAFAAVSQAASKAAAEASAPMTAEAEGAPETEGASEPEGAPEAEESKGTIATAFAAAAAGVTAAASEAMAQASAAAALETEGSPETEEALATERADSDAAPETGEDSESERSASQTSESKDSEGGTETTTAAAAEAQEGTPPGPGDPPSSAGSQTPTPAPKNVVLPNGESVATEKEVADLVAKRKKIIDDTRGLDNEREIKVEVATNPPVDGPLRPQSEPPTVTQALTQSLKKAPETENGAAAEVEETTSPMLVIVKEAVALALLALIAAGLSMLFHKTPKSVRIAALALSVVAAVWIGFSVS